MVLVRLAYVADLPVPAELVKSIAGGEPIATRTVPEPPAAPRPPAAPPVAETNAGMVGFEPAPTPTALPRVDGGNTAPVMAAPEPMPLPVAPPAPPKAPGLDPMPQSFAEVLTLFEKHGEVITRAQLRSQAHLVAFDPPRIEFRPAENAPGDLANRLREKLNEWTGTRWVVAISQAEGAPTLEQQAQARDNEVRSEVARHRLVRAVLDAFPGATIAAVRERFAAAEPAAAEDETAGEDDIEGAGASEEDEP
jgi:DNA polymerase-3 subunit gamma/tau